MEKFNLADDIKVFGLQVKDFPNGISNAFNDLINKTGDSAGERNYYGIGYMSKDGEVIYKALAEEKFEDEAEKYNYETSVIEKGEYFTETIKDWKSQTSCIKDVFGKMMQDNRIDKTKPCLEWYKNDEEMLCMIKAI